MTRKQIVLLASCAGLAAFILAVTLVGCSRTTPAPPAVSIEPWQDHAQKLAMLKTKPAAEFTEAEKLALISWLNDDTSAEHQRFATTHEMPPDGKNSYFVDLATTEARLHDNRALPALVTVMDVSQTIEASVAQFGDDAVDPVTAQLTNPEERFSAVQTLGFLLMLHQQNKNSLSPESADEIQKQLLALTADSYGVVRRLAVRALEFANPTPETLRAVKKLSVADPDHELQRTGSKPSTVYPVREAAKDTLKAWGR